jgi:hypothetical protein
MVRRGKLRDWGEITNPFLTAHDAQASLGNPLILNRVVGWTPTACRQSAVYALLCPPSDRLQCAVWPSSERRLTVKLCADWRQAVCRLTTGSAPTDDKPYPYQYFRVYVFLAIFPTSRTFDAMYAILRGYKERGVVVEIATISSQNKGKC